MNEPGTYRCINTNPDKKIWVLMDRQKKDTVREVGLSHLLEIDYLRIDHALIIGLVERWRPETNTFHLPTSKATVTLTDIEYIYGISIDGPPITGGTFHLPTSLKCAWSHLVWLHGLGNIPLALQSSSSG